MKPKIHPEYGKTTITCACGAVYHVGSTKKNIKVEICAKCHPFFTGVQKIVDTTGRVERFMRKYGYITDEKSNGNKAQEKDEGRTATVAEAAAVSAGPSSGEADRKSQEKTKDKARTGKRTAGKAEKTGDKPALTETETGAKATTKRARAKKPAEQAAEAAGEEKPR